MHRKHGAIFVMNYIEPDYLFEVKFFVYKRSEFSSPKCECNVYCNGNLKTWSPYIGDPEHAMKFFNSMQDIRLGHPLVVKLFRAIDEYQCNFYYKGEYLKFRSFDGKVKKNAANYFNHMKTVDVSSFEISYDAGLREGKIYNHKHILKFYGYTRQLQAMRVIPVRLKPARQRTYGENWISGRNRIM